MVKSDQMLVFSQHRGATAEERSKSGIGRRRRKGNGQSTRPLVGGVSGKGNGCSFQRTHAIVGGVSGRRRKGNGKSTRPLVGGVSGKGNGCSFQRTHAIVGGVSGQRGKGNGCSFRGQLHVCALSTITLNLRFSVAMYEPTPLYDPWVYTSYRYMFLSLHRILLI